MAGRPDPAFLNNVPTAITAGQSSRYATSPISVSLVSSTSVSSLTYPAISTNLAPQTTTETLTYPRNPDSIYPYNPLPALAIVFSMLYAILTLYHFYLSIFKPHVRKALSQRHSYTIPLFIACLSATLGYAFRTISIQPRNRSSLGLYALSQAVIIIGPIFACATLYLLFIYLINLCLPSGKSRVFLGISSHWMGKLFIISNTLSFLLQGAGSAIAPGGNEEGSQRDLGINILTFGLAVQLATFSWYLVVLALFCLRVYSGHETSGEEQSKGKGENGASQGTASRRDFGFNPLVKQVVAGIWIAGILLEVSVKILRSKRSKLLKTQSSGRFSGRSSSLLVHMGTFSPTNGRYGSSMPRPSGLLFLFWESVTPPGGYKVSVAAFS